MKNDSLKTLLEEKSHKSLEETDDITLNVPPRAFSNVPLPINEDVIRELYANPPEK